MKSSKIFFLFGIWGMIFYFSPYIANAQNLTASDNIDFKEAIISYGEFLPIDIINSGLIENCKWEIKSSSTNIQGNNKSLFEYKFETPGNYDIIIMHNLALNEIKDHSCSNHSLNIKLKVLDSKIKFSFDDIKFSSEIFSKDLSGETLQIPCYFESYNLNNISVSDLKIISAGVNTDIIGVLSGKTELKQGINVLTYNLSGSASKGTYIMFDFYDFNGQVQSFAFPNIIK